MLDLNDRNVRQICAFLRMICCIIITVLKIFMHWVTELFSPLIIHFAKLEFATTPGKRHSAMIPWAPPLNAVFFFFSSIMLLLLVWSEYWMVFKEPGIISAEQPSLVLLSGVTGGKRLNQREVGLETICRDASVHRRFSQTSWNDLFRYLTSDQSTAKCEQSELINILRRFV